MAIAGGSGCANDPCEELYEQTRDCWIQVRCIDYVTESDRGLCETVQDGFVSMPPYPEGTTCDGAARAAADQCLGTLDPGLPDPNNFGTLPCTCTAHAP
jgi:hypothetical protein